MIKRLLSRFPCEEINGRELCPTYLYRWHLLRLGWLNIYIHRFVGDDWAKDLHDHPKRFISIGLKGAYIEETFRRDSHLPGIPTRTSKLWRAPWVRTFAAEHAHRLRLTDEGDCWTLLIALRPVRQWGFWYTLPDNTRVWILWSDYVRELGELRKACE